MKILITGANGQLGREIRRRWNDRYELVLTDVKQLDIMDFSAVHQAIADVHPDVVVHGAAYTAVDAAEHDFDGAFRVNVVGTQNIASACSDYHIRMVYISTDYVFDGETDVPYREYDDVNPQSAYGHTKWLGEQAVRQICGCHYILRTAWLYGDGNNFVRTMLKLGREQQHLRVVSDQFGTPTSTADLVTAIEQVILSGPYGTYHATCNGSCSWYDFAVEIFQLAGMAVDISPVSTGEFPRPAQRPKHAVLDNYMLRMTGNDPMRMWQTALAEYLQYKE